MYKNQSLYKNESVTSWRTPSNIQLYRLVHDVDSYAGNLLAVARELQESLNTRQEIINEAKINKNTKMVKSVTFFRVQQDKELKLMSELILKISKTQLWTFEKMKFIDFVKKNSRACLTTLAHEFEVSESSEAGATTQPGSTLESDHRRYRVEQTGYGITDTWDEIVDTLMDIVPTTLEGGFEDMSAAITAHFQTLEAYVAALIAQTSSLQTQLTTTLGCIEILEARDPELQE
nr:hypothetical protein [Tanacetum cinerariifolium]